MALITDQPESNKLPKSVCEFIALAAEYREAELNLKKSRAAGSAAKRQKLSDRVELMIKVSELGERLDTAILNILPLNKDGN